MQGFNTLCIPVSLVFRSLIHQLAHSGILSGIRNLNPEQHQYVWRNKKHAR